MKFIVSSVDQSLTTAVKTLAESVKQHLAKEKDVNLQTSQLKLVIQELRADEPSGLIYCRIVAAGNLNGVGVGKEFLVTERFAPSENQKMMRDVVTFSPAKVVAEMVFPSPEVKFKVTPKIQSKIDGCFDRCTSDLLIHFDKCLGREGSSATKTWQLLQQIKIIGSIFVVIATVAARAMFGIKDENNAYVIGPFSISGIIATVFATIGFFVSMQLLSLLFMPTSFFTSDPRGRKAMALSGVKNVIGMRLLAFLLLIVFVVLGLGSAGAGILFK